MINLGNGVKWASVALILLTLGFGINKVYNIHLDVVKEAVIAAKKEVRDEFKDFQKEKEIIIRDLSEEERKILEAEIQAEKLEVAILREKLRDIEKFNEQLQNEPDEFIQELNAGTAEFYKSLEEATQ